MGKLATEGVGLELVGESGGVEDKLHGHGGGAFIQVERVGFGDVLDGGQQLMLVLNEIAGLGELVLHNVGSDTGQHLLYRLAMGGLGDSAQLALGNVSLLWFTI